MKINNLNHDTIEYKGNKKEEKSGMKEIINKFYSAVRAQMPLDGSFDDIKIQLDKKDDGEYFLLVHTFLNNRTNKYNNWLNVLYIPENKDFQMEMNLLDGSKQEILEFLGNEKNIDKIESYMNNLKRKADEK